jgi:chitin synthase
VPELISQRRRWLNGSFFAAIHSTVKFGYIYRSSHTFARKFWIHVEMFYQTFNLIFSWFALGNFYIAFVSTISFLSSFLPRADTPQMILANSMEAFGTKGINVLNNILQYLYLGLLVMCYLLSLGNRPQGSKWGYTLAFVGFGIITIYMTVSTLPFYWETALSQPSCLVCRILLGIQGY